MGGGAEFKMMLLTVACWISARGAVCCAMPMGAVTQSCRVFITVQVRGFWCGMAVAGHPRCAPPGMAAIIMELIMWQWQHVRTSRPRAARQTPVVTTVGSAAPKTKASTIRWRIGKSNVRITGIFTHTTWACNRLYPLSAVPHAVGLNDATDPAVLRPSTCRPSSTRFSSGKSYHPPDPFCPSL